MSMVLVDRVSTEKAVVDGVHARCNGIEFVRFDVMEHE